MDGLYVIDCIVGLTFALAATLTLLNVELPKTVAEQREWGVAAKGSRRLDPARNQVIVTVNHLGSTEYIGMVPKPSGTITLDAAIPRCRMSRRAIPIADVKTAVAQFDPDSNGDHFFDTAKYPVPTFVSNKVVSTGGSATIASKLTIHRISRLVGSRRASSAPAASFGLVRKWPSTFPATTTINRSNFGMGNGLPMVSDLVDLSINAGFEAR